VLALGMLFPYWVSFTTVSELVERDGNPKLGTFRLHATVDRVVEYPFNIGDVRNMLLTVSDGDASMSVIYNQLAIPYAPRIGDRVYLVGALVEYGPGPFKLLCTTVKKDE